MLTVREISVNPGSNTVLIMASSSRTSTLLSEFLSSMDSSVPQGMQGHKMMERKLRLYLWWKRKLSERKQEGKGPFALPDTSNEVLNQNINQNSGNGSGDGVSEALKKKDQMARERGTNRRRVRGGAPVGSSNSSGKAICTSRTEKKDLIMDEGEMRDEAANIAEL